MPMNAYNPYAKLNARYWTWINDGWVKLTLSPSQVSHWTAYQDTDEGYYAEVCQFRLEDGIVTEEWTTDATDCDGRLRRYDDRHCHIGNLHASPAYHDRNEPPTGFMVPDWKQGEASQRDDFAEAAGY